MLFSLKSLSIAVALLPLVVANTQDVQTRGTVPYYLVFLAQDTDSQAAADNTLERRLADPVIMINPTDANFGISAEAPGRLLTSADGTKIFAEARGNPAKPAIVFIHGFGIGAMAFDDIFNDPLWLARAYLVRYDTRGHGRSDKPTTAAAWVSQRLAEDFDAVVQSYNLVKPFVLGWSFGGSQIADVLSFHPQSYISGIIYDAGVPYQSALPTIGSPAGFAVVAGLNQTTNVTEFQSGYIDFINLCDPALDWDFYLACLGDGVVQPRAILNLSFTRTQNNTGLIQAGTTGALPTLAIFGGDDQVVLKQGILNALAGWQNLTVVTLPDAQHFTWISRPVLFRATVLNWIGA
ncbi:putative oxidoreductase ephD [Mycena sanguinolenta]|uniref:Putative oxidoreductase ephD n=1 Tax=Mycena sanguinolenta TaxID=230812 RepID=A0A8H6XJG4_9AGAR|nr:putative oxidoreductase ephD [Mycena sanguinolenta]